MTILATASSLISFHAAAADKSQVQLIEGAPAASVVQRIGHNTPQVLNKYDATSAHFTSRPELVALGRKLFFDTRLSEPAGTACATCHDPARAFMPDLSARRAKGPGTPQGSRPGHFSTRNAPSLLYVRYVPILHFYQDDDAPFASPFGGLMIDGRADTLAAQMRLPLLDRNEMNNRSPARLLQKLKRLEYGEALAQHFDPSITRKPEAMLRAAGKAVAAFLQSDEMAPFNSRFDDYLRQRTPLSTTEMRGLALFKDPEKGNCHSCHTLADTASNPVRALFTDFGYDAIAVPRNMALPANRNPKHFDNGLCTTATALGWPEPDQWCSYLRTPNLRNVALRQRFMHNGVLTSLRDAVAFYNTRSIEPVKWYARGQLFDDVPVDYRGNVNINSTPLNRRKGMAPAMSDAEIDDIVAFLKTLTEKQYLSLQDREEARHQE